ncbi:RNA polymerase sigma factor [Amycolatopsis keratiniphila]|uniref:RNA polymerase sigma factor n=1 Tax=Amycolatopsis keratiniphila TaxID=129921 RepID=R4T939_9PSEU|nr:sigma-70 family RNA polymerase sigma factor [Amycolatopsis keratiniphila]AGM07078.1 RNA polymerase sigma factor [Amycolatopsis keratiniphila]
MFETDPRYLYDLNSDSDLVAAFRAGDVSAFSALYVRHRITALRYARRLSTCDATAEDVVADAFINIYLALLAGRGPRDDFRNYLISTVRNITIHNYRKNRRLKFVDDIEKFAHDTELSPAAILQERIQSHLERSRATHAFLRLPESWRQILTLTILDERPIADVAAIVGRTPNATHALALRARRGLRATYAELPDAA